MVERASHRLVLRRRLPPPFSPVSFYVSPEGGLRYLRPSLAEADRPLLDRVTEFVHPGATVWDVGANVGLFAFAAAAAAGPGGHVIAVEPDTWLVGLLRRSARLAGDRAPVTVVPVAVSDQVGLARFHIARRNRSTNYLDGFGTTQTGGSREEQIVPTVTIDHLGAEAFPWPSVLKIDVEGAEVPALRGAAATLRHRPVVICEVAGENSKEVAGLLADAGYRLYDGLLPADQRSETDLAPEQTLALPI